MRDKTRRCISSDVGFDVSKEEATRAIKGLVRADTYLQISAMKQKVILLAAFLLAVQSATCQLCPQCTCRNSYAPVCARNKVTGKLRGFSSQCVLNCTNKCRDNRFEYLGPGRCGHFTTRTTLETTPIPYVK
ncbi:uncharacterized protein LOC110839703 [Zootermopsis nevadensis]|uniref:Kazal-like domain-containing protein n=1 Tax=Zootermopsis nevadensis TaxID=136037 RepID=A0A067RJV1_ZOONE|nr:uncharacterized protein LOC110839703 [Zootermopsis nevadensis]KDR23288.1 hypothetical protein L798_15595 [Zootermopsis nevadensis]